MSDSRTTRRDDALVLAEELLTDVELGRIEPLAIARKASRLARLLDDTDAMAWLAYETGGYGSGKLNRDAWAAALRSGRVSPNDDGRPSANVRTLGELSQALAAATLELQNADSGVSHSEQAVLVQRQRAARLNSLHEAVSHTQGVIDRILGAIHSYISERYQELRFGSAVESAFGIVRADVDRSISDLVPRALPMIAAAFENASSQNPEQWQNAASTCRRLLMTAADELRPPGPDVDGRKMGPGNYVNRLVDWVVSQSQSKTAARMVAADLSYLGPRLDAADQAGQKGAHVGSKPVTRYEASRYVTGTYLVLGDILQLRADSGSDNVSVADDANAPPEPESAASPS
jgi:hypothetical protein